jgi:hypothetical protein
MSGDERCLRCGSGKLIPMVPVQDQGQYSSGRLSAHVGFTNPESWFFKGAVSAKLSATICGECGHTELTAEDPVALYQAYLAGQVHQDRNG